MSNDAGPSKAPESRPDGHLDTHLEVRPDPHSESSPNNIILATLNALTSRIGALDTLAVRLDRLDNLSARFDNLEREMRTVRADEGKGAFRNVPGLNEDDSDSPETFARTRNPAETETNSSQGNRGQPPSQSAPGPVFERPTHQYGSPGLVHDRPVLQNGAGLDRQYFPDRSTHQTGMVPERMRADHWNGTDRHRVNSRTAQERFSSQTPVPAQAIAEASKRSFKGTKFDSKTDNVLEWSDQFRGYIETRTYDIPTELKESISIRWLGEALTGTPEQYWFMDAKKSCRDLESFLEDLEDNFVSDKMRREIGSIEHVRNCKQREKESTKMYLLRFERCFERYRRAMQKKRTTIDDKQVMQALYAGLRSLEIAKEVKRSSNVTKAFAAARSAADEE
ncbi:hypothetical protein BGZ59_004622, partial [Podila verticillata]